MKNILPYLFATSIFFTACEAKKTASQPVQEVVVDPVIEAAVEASPEPGEATATTLNETPLAQKNLVAYSGEDGSSVSCLYSFDEEKRGVVNIIRPGIQDLVLKQEGEAWPQGALYSDGNNKWEAHGETAIFSENGKSVNYKTSIN